MIGPISSSGPLGSGGPQGPLSSGPGQSLSANEILSQVATYFGDTAYLDMGKLYGYITSSASGIITWWPTINFNQEKLDAFLGSLFGALKQDGCTGVFESFAQLSDIGSLTTNNPNYNPDDTIQQMFGYDCYPVGTTGKNFLSYFNNFANQYVSTNLSFGGQNATNSDWTLPSGMSPAQAAMQLADFMHNYGFIGVDFDIEGGGPAALMANGNANVISFFQALHGTGIQPQITLEASISQGPAGLLAPLFEQFNSMFDAIRLMCYSTTQYYIDATGQDWAISEWLKYINPIMLHIGFYDSINYLSPGSSAGESYYLPNGLTNGQAAAYIFLSLETALYKINPDFVPLGKPFIWTDDPTTISSNAFFSDFNQYLENNTYPVPLIPPSENLPNIPIENTFQAGLGDSIIDNEEENR